MLRSSPPVRVIPVDPDLEVHVNKVTVNYEGGTLEYGEVREFVPSTNSYTRGLLLPLSAIGDVASGLARIAVQ